MSSKFAILAAAGVVVAAGAAVSPAGAEGERAWVEAPSVADVAAAYPARAKAAGVRGEVELTCDLGRDGHPRDCAALTEKPGGYGFGAAAAKVATRLKASDQSLTHQNIFIPVTFDPGVLTGETTITKPAWAAVPTAEDFQATFPKTQNGVNHVRVVLGCTVGANGALGGCSVAQEDPPGQGYGDGALALASKFRVGPWSQDGEPTAGARIRLPIRYELTPVKQ